MNKCYTLKFTIEGHSANYASKFMAYVFGCPHEICRNENEMRIFWKEEFNKDFNKGVKWREEGIYPQMVEIERVTDEYYEGWTENEVYTCEGYYEKDNETYLHIHLLYPLNTEWEKRLLKRILAFEAIKKDKPLGPFFIKHIQLFENVYIDGYNLNYDEANLLKTYNRSDINKYNPYEALRFNPCIDYCFMRNGKEYSSKCDDKCEYAKVVKEKEQLEEFLNQPIRNLDDLVVFICENIECKNCPIITCNFDKRSKYEKEELQTPCCNNLYKWINAQLQE